MSTLNPKQKRFVAEFLIDSNATQAAIRAGYSPASAKVTASRMLTKANVAAAVATGRTKITDELEITAASLIRDMARIRDKAEANDEYQPAIKATEMLGKSLKEQNPFNEVPVEHKIIGSDDAPTTPLQLGREIAFALTLAMQDAAKAPKSESPDTPSKQNPRATAH